MNPRARILLAAAVVLAAAAACGKDSPTGPTSGVVTLSLVTPNADDGAVTLVLTGPGIASLDAASSAYAVYWRVVSATEARGIVVGNLSAGVIATASVGDANHVGDYHVEILEVASRSDDVRASTAGYAVTLAGRH
ncbi:MAG: hypothetical protein AUG10_05490 [Gemmatimonadetes bacterium 13_1_20CM_2_70_10]|nr:MAG: hypothetical protein AUG10_05490 [Gemmatimonadetes bacterium 13_1_20CM_2_70_10]